MTRREIWFVDVAVNIVRCKVINVRLVGMIDIVVVSTVDILV